MKRLLLSLAVWLVAGAVGAATLPGSVSIGGPSGKNQWAYDFTSTATAGVYSIGPAWPIATLDFELGSAFSAVLYACDTSSPDSDSDGDLSDEGACVSLATLSADTSLSAMRARKRHYAIDINTAESASNTSRLTIKGTWDQVSAEPSTNQPNVIVLYGDSLTDDGTASGPKNDCDWCAPLATAGIVVYNAAANGARNHTNSEESCVDLYDTGGPPQTSGSPDGFCDSDGSTTHLACPSSVNGYNQCYHGERQINVHPTLGSCSRGTSDTTRDMFGDSANDLTCLEDLNVEGAVYYFGVNMVTQGAVAGWDSTFEALSRNAARDQLDTIHWDQASECVVVLGPKYLTSAAAEPENSDRNDNLREFQTWLINETRAAYPRCKVVDLYQAVDDYETAHGTAAMLGLYDDCTTAWTSCTDGTHFEESDPNSIGDIGSEWSGHLILQAIREAHENMMPGFSRSVPQFQHLFRHDPLTRSWRQHQGLAYDATEDMVTTQTQDVWGIATLQGVEIDAFDQACLIRLHGGSGGETHGCLFRVNAADFANSQHLLVASAGTGFVDIYELTGATATNAVSVAAVDVGNLGPDDCIGIVVNGYGDQMTVKVTPADCSNFTDIENDPDSWPACHGGFYDQATATTCSGGNATNTQVDFANSGFASGLGVGIYVHDEFGVALDGIEEVWWTGLNP